MIQVENTKQINLLSYGLEPLLGIGLLRESVEIGREASPNQSAIFDSFQPPAGVILPSAPLRASRRSRALSGGLAV